MQLNVYEGGEPWGAGRAGEPRVTLSQVKGYEVICLRLQVRQVFFFSSAPFSKDVEKRSEWVWGKRGTSGEQGGRWRVGWCVCVVVVG